MIHTTVENENTLERQHSCKWYFDEAKEIYDAIVKEKEGRLDARLSSLDETMGQFELLDNKSEEYCCTIFKKLLDAMKDSSEEDIYSIFPLFVMKIKEETKGSKDFKAQRELFEGKKFEICKTLNAIDCLISRLCSDNVDSSFQSNNGTVVGSETILNWLYTAASQGEKTIQEYDRETILLRQIVNWYAKQKSEKKETPNSEQEKHDLAYRAKNVQRFLLIFVSSTENGEFADKFGWNKESKDALLAQVKQVITGTLNDIADAYKKLSGFRRYAIQVELATEDMKTESEINKLLSLAKAILDFLLSVCASYMRISALALPRGEFKGARLIHSNVSGSNFSNADFRYVNMSYAIAKDCDFSSASLCELKADNADFTQSLFSYADLSGADLSGATINQAKLDAVALGQYPLSVLREIYDKITKKEEPKKSNAERAFEKKFANVLPDADSGKKAKSEYKEAPNMSDEIQNITKENSNGGLLSKDVLEDLYNSYEKYGKALAEMWNCKYLSKEIYEDCLAQAFEIQAGADNNHKRLVKLSGASIKNSMLPDSDLSLIEIDSAAFTESDLSGVTMAHTVATGAEFNGTNLAKAQAYQAKMENATFRNALLFGAEFVNCHMDGVNFDQANLSNVKMLNTDTTHQNYISRAVEAVTVNEVKDIPQIKEDWDEDTSTEVKDDTTNRDNTFCNAIASRGQFFGCDFSRSAFRSATIRSSVWFDVNAQSTLWDSADLTYSILCGVLFNRSSLKGTSLQETKIYAVDFSCCNLSEAKMLGCTLDKVLFYDSNMNGVNLSHSAVRNTVFRQCLIERLNVSNTTFENCYFLDVDFGSCIALEKVKFINCVFDSCRFDGKLLSPKDDLGKSCVLHIGASDESGVTVYSNADNAHLFSTDKR